MRPVDVWKCAGPAQNTAALVMIGGGTARLAEPIPPPTLRDGPLQKSWPGMRTYDFRLQYLRHDPRAPAPIYAVFGSGPGYDWEMVAGPWQQGKGPYHGW